MMSEDQVSRLLQILKDISPMPSDDDPDLTSERLDLYADVMDEIRELFQSQKDPRFIRPLLNSFGYGEGYEVYWDTIGLLEQFPPEILRPQLREALRTGERGTRKWVAYMLGLQRNVEDVPALILALQDPEGQVRHNALIALSMIGDKSARAAMEHLFEDPVEEVRKAAREYVEALLDQRYVIRSR
jgi:hypothetical protein